jgi:hypothetical protein
MKATIGKAAPGKGVIIKKVEPPKNQRKKKGSKYA